MIEAFGWRVSWLDAGTLKLDGGAMFGNVPRVLWERTHAPDAQHRIDLVTRLLLLEGHGRRVLVDTGTGHLWTEKEEAIFAVRADPEPGVVAALARAGLKPSDISDVVLTHLHFDHAGGVSRRGADGEPELTFPDARHHVQRANLENGRAPNERERASYLERHLAPLGRADLALSDGTEEILPGIIVERSDGHTIGLQTVRIGEGEGAIVFPADLAPLATHLRIPWTMGYDVCPLTIMEEKRHLLERAEDQGWRIVLEHDPLNAGIRVGRDERGRFLPTPLED